MRQLSLLAEGLRALGVQTHLVTGADIQPARIPADTCAIVLLGYPDQFPFLAARCRLSVPVFLWAQFSRPPDADSLAAVVAVPLTEITRIHLTNAGIRPLGPTIPHAVDTRFYRPFGAQRRSACKQVYGWSDCFVVGTVGVNTTRKRFDRLLTAFAALREKTDRARLLIKTDSERKTGGFDLPALTRRLGLQKVLKTVTGELSKQRMAEIYASMDVYAHVAEWEGFGIPVLEAMACGAVIVTHPIQGPAELLPYRETMVLQSELVREGDSVLRWVDPRALAEVLQRVAASPDLRETLGRRGVAEARKYRPETVAAHWQTLLSGRRWPTE